MKAEKAIERAEHALHTNQPMLAQTYMKAALRDLEARDRRRRPVHYFFKDLDEGMQEVGKIFKEIGEAAVEAFKPLTDLFAFDSSREASRLKASALRDPDYIYGPEFFRSRVR